MMKISSPFSCPKAILVILIFVILGASASDEEQVVVKRGERRSLGCSEYGEISAARVVDESINASYLVHFFTLDPNSLFLPVILHADMLFYVHTGSGKLRWREEGDEVKNRELRRGDIHRLQAGALFFIQSNLDTDSDRQKLRIHAIFPNSDKYTQETGPYSSIRDMILGFDNKVLQAAFKVPLERIQELVNGTKPPAIIHALSATKNAALEMEARFIEKLFGATTPTSNNIFEINKKKQSKKEKEKDKEGSKVFNFFKADKDFANCNGWSTAVTSNKMTALTGTDIGLFMVNLTEGSMMGPHWNPTATEIGVVLQGRGMVRVVCAGNSNVTGCKNMRFEVEEGDTFVVPRFHAMAQMAFNNDTFVFMGFSTSAHTNHPQYLAGQASVLRTLEKEVLAVAFNVTDTTMDQLLSSQRDSVILGCISCAEEELKIVEEEMEKERAAERERAAEEAREREEERRKEASEREEKEAARQEEEEAARQEEERERREEEEERKSEEEEARRRAAEEERKREEEKERKREEEAREREEASRRAEEEERKKEEEERKREEETTRRAEEEEQAKEREEEEEREREEEQAKEREEEEEREREEEQAKEREEEAARRAEEEEREREEEQAKEREEEAARRAEEEEREREEEEARERERQEEEAREREEATRKAEEEEERKKQEEEEEDEWSRKKEEGGGKSEQEQAEEEEEPHAIKTKKTLFHLIPNSLGRFRVY